MARRPWIAVCAVIAAFGVAPRAHADGKNEVRAVTFDEDSGVTRVHVRGAQTPTFTVYKLERPSRVVIDMPQARLAEALRGHESAAVLTPSTWAVSTIAAQQLDDGAVRVIVTLARPGRYDVKTEGNELVVLVMPRDPAPKTASPEELARAQAESEQAKKDARAAEARAEAAQRAADEARAAQQKAATNTADLERAKATTAKAQTEAARAKADAAKASELAAQSQADADRMRASAEQVKRDAAAESQKAQDAIARAQEATKQSASDRAEAQRVKAEAERMRQEAEHAMQDVARAKQETDAVKVAAETAKRDAEQAKQAADAKRSAADAAMRDAEAAKRDAQAAKRDADAKRVEVDAAKREIAKASDQLRAEADAAKAAAESAKGEAAREKAEADKLLQDAKQQLATIEKRAAATQQLEDKARSVHAAAQAREEAARQVEAKAIAERERAEQAAKQAQDARDRAAASDRAKLAAEARGAEDRLAQAKRATDDAEARRLAAEQAAQTARRELEQTKASLATVEQQRAQTESAALEASRKRSEAEAAASDAGRRRSEAELAAAEAAKKRSEAERAASAAEAARAAADKQRAVALESARVALASKQQAEASLAELSTRRASAERAAAELEARTRAEAKAQADLAATKVHKAGDDEQAAARAQAAKLADERKRAEDDLAERRKAVAAQQAEVARLETAAAQARDAAAREEARRILLAHQRESDEQQLAELEQKRLDAQRKLEADAKLEAARKLEAQRRQDADKQLDADRKQASSKQLEAEQQREAARRADAEKQLAALEQRKHEAEAALAATEKRAAERKVEAEKQLATGQQVAVAKQREADERLAAAKQLEAEQEAAARKQREAEQRAAAQLKLADERLAAAQKLEAEQKQAAQKVEAQKLEAQKVAAQKPAPKADAKKPAGPLPKVQAIDFHGQVGSSEVDIALQGDAASADVHIGEITAQHVELLVDRAELAPKLERTLDVSRFGSPLKSVSSFHDRRTPGRVRLIAELAQPATPTIERDAAGRVHWRFVAANDKRQARTTNLPSPIVGGFGAASTPIAQQSVSQVPPAPGGRRRIYHGATVDLDFKDAPIHDLLRIIADTGHVNLVVPETIDAKVTVRLKRVPWDEALEVILASHGLWYRREGNLYRIAPRKELDAEDEAEAARREAAVKAEAPKPQVVRLNYASAEELKQKLEGMLSPKGKIEVDGRTNALIINDVAGNRDQIARLAFELDTQTPQITIEARIVEANSDFVRQIGVQWGGNALASPGGGNATGLIFPSSVAVTGANDDSQTRSTGVTLPSDFAVNLPATTGSGEGGALGLSLGSIGGNFNINLRLSALEDVGTVRIISAPKITVLNNKLAEIRQGVSIPISVVSAAGTQTQFVQADLKLTVKPYVSQRDCAIAMDLEVTKNEPDFVNTGARGDPTIVRKEARTTMLVNDGETTVLGGIYTRNSGLAYKKVPFFGDLPFIGWFFKNRRENDNRTEVLVFITPKITNKASLRCVQ